MKPTPIDWFLAVLRKYAVFEGRARRAEYWNYVLVYLIIAIVVSLLANLLPGVLGGLFNLIYMGISLALLVPSLAVAVRRLHDTGREWWYILLGIIPLVNLYVLYLMTIDSDPGSNQYGPNPKALV